MERLTYRAELGVSIDKNEDCPTCSICWNCDIPPRKCMYISDALEKLANYEDLEEQGLLLRLPCKVGSTLYQPISNQINEYKAIGLCFDITRNEFVYEVIYQIGLEWYKTTCDFDCINKTVFLTKAEAEQKLKEMNTNNGIAE